MDPRINAIQAVRQVARQAMESIPHPERLPLRHIDIKTGATDAVLYLLLGDPVPGQKPFFIWGHVYAVSLKIVIGVANGGHYFIYIVNGQEVLVHDTPEALFRWIKEHYARS